MGCNGWNHQLDCNCGWGGDTGGRGGGVFTVQGLDWSNSKPPREESYVNPNARCPVCGADVFFYQSPYGGRVYFDELGPPWPKHPCTDNFIGRFYQRSVLPSLTTRDTPISKNPNQWSPLIHESIEKGSRFDKFFIDKKSTGISGRFLALPSGVFRDVPIFWRRDASDPSLVDVSSIQVDANYCEPYQGNERKETVPSWMSSDEDIEAFLRSAPLTAETLNGIGWSLSFHWRDTENPNWHLLDYVNWDKAREYFEKAAELGFWAALNNLGVIYRDGFGVTPDPIISFRCFESAAQHMDAISIRHLAGCYRTGWGVKPDDAQAAFLNELAELMDIESKG
jgi:hypothetical protein